MRQSLSAYFSLIAGVALLASVHVKASTAAPASPAAKITITSFARACSRDCEVAEVCGVVSGSTQPMTNLTIIADYNTGNPATYHTFAGSDGRFCQLVATINGTVEVGFADVQSVAHAQAILR